MYGGRLDKSSQTEEYAKLLGLLRQLRRQAGLRQVDVAAQLDEPQSFVSKYEAGERRLDIIETRAIVGVLGVDLHTFVALLEQVLETKAEAAE